MPEDVFSACFSEGDDQEGLSRDKRLRHWLAEFWSMLCISGETGATDRATLDEIEREVTDAMYSATPDLARAESLTFMAMHVISGNKI